ncbi:MAG: hypothetical protein ABEJ89_05390 [Haloarculaceae archaeon]
MARKRFLPVAYGWLLVQGLIAALAPRRSIDLNNRLLLCSFENPGDLEPKPWYVRMTRVAGVGMVAAGLAGLLTVVGDGDVRDDEDGPAAEPITVDVDEPAAENGE